MRRSRGLNVGSYRYGFQGQEMDDEVKGKGNSVNYKYRMHDPRVGRFFAVDPLTKKYPHYTPYQFSGNKLIHAVELEGLEEAELNSGEKIHTGPVNEQSMIDILEKGGGWENENYVTEWPDGVQGVDQVNITPNYGPSALSSSSSLDSEDEYGGAGLLEYADEVIGGLEKHTSGLKNGGGYLTYSTAKNGKGLYLKPNAQGLNNLKGVSINVNNGLKIGGPLVGVVLEVPEIVGGYKQSTHLGNKQMAGAAGSVAGGWFGGMIAGGSMGLLGIETGPGVIITVIGGAVVGGFIGEEGVEEIYEYMFGD